MHCRVNYSVVYSNKRLNKKGCNIFFCYSIHIWIPCAIHTRPDMIWNVNHSQRTNNRKTTNQIKENAAILHSYSWLPKEHDTCSLFFFENVPRNTLIWQQHSHRFFHKYQDRNNKGKDEKKKQKYVNSPLEYVLSQACLLFALLKYNHNYFFLQWMIFTAVWKLLLLVILFTKLILFFCFFSVIILNNKPCQVWVCLPTCIFGSNMLIVFLPFCTATLLFGQHFHMAVKSNDPWYEGYHFVVNFAN